MRHHTKLLSFFLLKEKVLITFALLTGFLLSLTGIFLPLCLGKFYQLGLHTKSLRGSFLEQSGIIGTSSLDFVVLFIVVIVCRVLLVLLFSRLSHRVSTAVTNELLQRFFTAQITAEWGRFSEKTYGKYLNRYSGNLRSVELFIEQGIIRFISDMVFLICCLFLFFFLDPVMAFVVSIALLLFAIPVVLLQRKQHVYDQKIKDRKSSTLAFVQESFASFYSDWAFNKNSLKPKKFKDLNSKRAALVQQKNNYQSIIDALVRIFPWTILCILMIVLLFFRDQTGTHDNVIILVFFMLLVNISSVLRRTIKVNTVWASGISSLKKIAAWIPETNGIPAEQTSTQKTDATVLELKEIVTSSSTSISLKVVKGACVEIHFGNAQEIQRFMNKILMVDLHGEETLSINGKQMNATDSYEFRRSVSCITQLFPPAGKTLSDALLYSKNSKKEHLIQPFYSEMGMGEIDFSQKPDPENWSIEAMFTFQCCRAWLTQKPFVFLDHEMENTVYRLSESLHKRLMDKFIGRSIIRMKLVKNT